jgi:hypothetical protein
MEMAGYFCVGLVLVACAFLLLCIFLDAYHEPEVDLEEEHRRETVQEVYEARGLRSYCYLAPPRDEEYDPDFDLDQEAQ